MPVRRAVINEDYHYGSQCNNMKGTRIIDYHGPDGPGRRQNCCMRALNQAAARSADLLRRSFRRLTSQNENQKSSHTQERNIISTRWLTMALTIIRLENYVRKCRTLKTTPDPAKLNESCTCILTMRRDLISHQPNSTDQNPLDDLLEAITEKRALLHLTYAMQENQWVAESFTLMELFSTIQHIDSMEHYKVTRDPQNLFVIHISILIWTST
jgi:hypothetical protein